MNRNPARGESERGSAEFVARKLGDIAKISGQVSNWLPSGRSKSLADRWCQPERKGGKKRERASERGAMEERGCVS